MDSNPAIVFEDRHLVVVVKPARLPTASDSSGDESLITQVRRWHLERQPEGKKGYFAPLHFLDRPVSGLVMFALSSKAAARLAKGFRDHTIRKIYLAVVECSSTVTEGPLTDWLLKDPKTNVTRVVPAKTPGAKESKLTVRLVRRQGDLALLQVEPVTGRSHQIRVQLSSRGMPIVGDLKYGAQREFDHAIMLHAARLTFNHPTGQKPVTVTAPPPASWKKIFNGALDVPET